MGDSQPLTQRGWAKRFPLKNVHQKSLGVSDFAQRLQPHRELTYCLITAGKLRLNADSTWIGQGRQVHRDPHSCIVIVCEGLWQSE